MLIEHLPREFRDAEPSLAREALGARDALTLEKLWPWAMENIERYSAIIASRPHYQPKWAGEDTDLLRHAACERQCDKCYMACAIAPERLKWWENQLAKACGSSQIGRA